MSSLRERNDWFECERVARQRSPKVPEEIWEAAGSWPDELGERPLTPDFLKHLVRHLFDVHMRALEKTPGNTSR